MRFLLAPFLLLAGLGFLLSLAAHLCALCGLAPMGQATMALHVGIFLVWFPALIVSRGRVGARPGSKDWRENFRGCPRWMAQVTGAAFVYAIVNFTACLAANSLRGPNPQGNEAAAIRIFSGHWMVFYSVAFAMLYARWVGRAEKELADKGAATGDWREFEDWS